MYTVQGFKITTAEQARTMLLVAMLKGDFKASEDAHWVLKCLEAAGK